MTTFVWLTIGHLMGDWVLQNDWMAKGKQVSWGNRAGITHFGIYTIVVLAALWLSDGYQRSGFYYLPIGLGIFISHWLIDAGALAERWMRLYRQSNLEVVRLMVDQT